MLATIGDQTPVETGRRTMPTQASKIKPTNNPNRRQRPMTKILRQRPNQAKKPSQDNHNSQKPKPSPTNQRRSPINHPTPHSQPTTPPVASFDNQTPIEGRDPPLIHRIDQRRSNSSRIEAHWGLPLRGSTENIEKECQGREAANGQGREGRRGVMGPGEAHKGCQGLW